MKIVYFPYTVIDPRKAEKLAALWGPPTLLQPSPEARLPETRALEEAGLIETLCPETGHFPPLTDCIKAFEQWAEQSAGSDLEALMKQGAPIPFFSDQSLARIVAELRSNAQSPGQDAPDRSSLPDIFQAQLLLAMAQKLDRQQDELALEIETLARKERHMLALLKGEEELDSDSLSAPWPPPSVRRDVLLDLRLKAWAGIMGALPDGEKDFPGAGTDILFLTDSQGVMAQIQEVFPEARLRLQACPLPAESLPAGAADRLPSWIAKPLTSRSVSASEPQTHAPTGFDLLEIPGVPVEGFYRQLAGGRRQKDGVPKVGPSAESCWVGALRWPGDAGGGAAR